MFDRNEGRVDQTIRIIAGLVLLSLVFVGPRTLFGLIGLVPIVTGIVGFCPLYRIVGIRTYPADGGKQ